MEPIDERANNAWFDYEYTEAPTLENMFKDGFKAGVESERDRPTKWNDPNKPPQHEKRVIVDAVLPSGARLVTGGLVCHKRISAGMERGYCPCV